jgi:hypothetical protein
LGAGLLGHVVGELLFIPVGAWVSVITAYVYITCGPSSVAAMGPPAPGFESATPPSHHGMQTSMSPARFCPDCGTQVEFGAKFCRKCGKAIS